MKLEQRLALGGMGFWIKLHGSDFKPPKVSLSSRCGPSLRSRRSTFLVDIGATADIDRAWEPESHVAIHPFRAYRRANLNVEPSADIAETTRMTRQEHCRLQATDPFRNADAS